MENNDLLDNLNFKEELRKIENSIDEYSNTEESPIQNGGAYEFNESLPFEDEIRAITEYYDGRVRAISKYKSKFLIEKEINRVLQVLKKMLERSNIPKEMRFAYEDMIMDLPFKVQDESVLLPLDLEAFPDTYEEIKTENIVK